MILGVGKACVSVCSLGMLPFMRRGLIIFFLLLFLLLALLGGWFWFLHRPEEPTELFLYGNVDVRQVDIGFRVGGLVTDLYFEEGDLVRKGDLLARIEQAPYNSQLVQSQANLKGAKVTLDNAEILLRRRLELISSLGVSQEDVDNALANRNSAQAAYEQAEAALKIAEDNLSYTGAYAPTDGIILTRVREPGTVLNPANPVYTLSISSPVWIRAYVDEPQLGMIYYGMPAQVHTDTEGGRIYHGKIGFISPVAEFTPKTVETTQLRTDLVYRLRLYVDDADQFLKQGMPVTIELSLSRGP